MSHLKKEWGGVMPYNSHPIWKTRIREQLFLVVREKVKIITWKQVLRRDFTLTPVIQRAISADSFISFYPLA